MNPLLLMNHLLLLMAPGAIEWIFILIALVFLLIYPVSLWVIFIKAGRQGWEGVIPVYNVFIGLQIIGKPWWWAFLLIIPYVNLVFIIWSLNMLSKSFGQSSGFTAGLFFFSYIFLPILSFGDAVYQGPYGDEEAYQAYQSTLNPVFEFEVA
jgi:hypothetical protein